MNALLIIFFSKETKPAIPHILKMILIQKSTIIPENTNKNITL